MQNHLLQVLALVAMEQPLNFSPENMLAEKLKVLQACAHLATFRKTEISVKKRDRNRRAYVCRCRAMRCRAMRSNSSVSVTWRSTPMKRALKGRVSMSC
jgi:hypothetical protein